VIFIASFAWLVVADVDQFGFPVLWEAGVGTRRSLPSHRRPEPSTDREPDRYRD